MLIHNEKVNAYERTGSAMPADEGATASGYKTADYRRYATGYYSSEFHQL